MRPSNYLEALVADTYIFNLIDTPAKPYTKELDLYLKLFGGGRSNASFAKRLASSSQFRYPGTCRNGLPAARTLVQMGADQAVTTFTASDFGRSFVSNGNGTDHGWGGHHFVMGGAVRGGDLYGSFPVYGAKNANNNNFDSSADQLGNGALLPSVSVDQLGATLGRWFGLSDTQILDVFPNLANFSTRDLGFMNPA